MYWVVVDKTRSQSSIAIFNLKLSITDLLTHSLTGVGARRVELGDAMASKKLLRDFQKDPGSQFLSILVQDTRGTPYILRNWGDGVAPQGWGGPSFTTLVRGDPPLVLSHTCRLWSPRCFLQQCPPSKSGVRANNQAPGLV